jgi:putative ABC transport system permease protein
MSEFAADVRMSVRALLREPGFALGVVLMLAVGLGAVTAAFSLVNSVLLRPLAYQSPDRLVAIREVIPQLAHVYPSLPVNARHFVEWRKECRSFESMAILDAAALNLTGADEPERIDAARVSPNLFRVLGVRMATGRDFSDDEEQDGRNNVAVLTDHLWRRRFAGDPTVVGKTVMLNGHAHVVIGVLPADFRFPDRSAFAASQSLAPRRDLFVPKVFSRDELEELVGRFNYGVIARLRPGAAPQRATAELEAVQARMEELAGERVHERALITPLLDIVVGDARRGLLVLMGAISVLLLIVCVNVANLLLARGERHGREAAVRAALGASRSRLLRHALAESLLLAAAGGALAILVASGGIELLTRYAPVDIPRLDEVRLDMRVLAFSGALVAAAALFFGLLPAWRISGADPQTILRSGGRGSIGSRAGMRLRSALVACEVGLSAMLLILAGLLTNSFARLMHADKGFRAPTVLAVDIALAGDRYKEDAAREGFYRRVFQSLDSAPGVQASAISSALPLQGETWIDNVSPTAPSGSAQKAPFQGIPINVRFVSFDYFRTMGIPVQSGRPFSENDRTRKVAIISENVAAAFWPNQNPIGRRFTRGNDQWFEVVGVVGNVRANAEKTPVAMMYRPYWDWMPYHTVLVARASGDPYSIAGAVRAAIHSGDADVPVPRMSTMSEVLDESVATRRFQMALAAMFGMMSLLVASLGVYAVVSYSVAQRTPEMGIRAALGAGTADLYRLILRQGMAPVAAGVVCAIAGAVAFGQVLKSLLYEITGSDPVTIGAVVLLLLTVALGACLIPTRRAARVDPVTALRCD